MTKTAKAITEPMFMPDRIVTDPNGTLWLVFMAGIDAETYGAFKAMPKFLAFDGKTLMKLSFNSDNGAINYKEIDPAMLAKPTKL